MKSCLQSAAPVFSAECDAMTGFALTVPALPSFSDVLPLAAYDLVLQSLRKTVIEGTGCDDVTNGSQPLRGDKSPQIEFPVMALPDELCHRARRVAPPHAGLLSP